jgi:putative ABC transport system permease protein
MKYLALVLVNLKRRKLRTALTVLSIAVAFLLFGYLGAIRNSFSAGIEVAGQDRLIVREKVSLINPLPVSYEGRIERMDGVSNAVHQSWFGGIYQDKRNFFPNIAVVPEDFLDMYPEFELEEDERAAFINTRTGAIAGRGLAERFGWKVGDIIPLMGPIWTKKDGSQDWEFNLVGIYDSEEKGVDLTQFFFNWNYLDEARQYGTGMTGWYAIRIDDPARAADIAAAVDREFANSQAETRTEPEGAFVQSFANQVGNIGLIITAIVAVVFFTILLVAGNTMANAVRERTNELAVLKAIGFTDRGVLGLVLGESLVLAGLGGVLGLGLAWLLVSNGDPTGGSFPVFFIPLKDVVVGVLLVVALALVAGILPALQAQRLQVAEALRR